MIKQKLEDIEMAIEENAGFCLACGEIAYGVEPDCRGYQCDYCGKRQVFGAEEMVLMGMVQ